MIKTSEAIRAARALIGTPYSELDCINLIKKVIRTAPGGDKRYTTAGTNELWNSFDSVPKYRHLIWRQTGISGAKPGMLAFMGVGTGDVDHTGLVTERGTVIHSSKSRGGVVETALTEKNGWNGLGKHRMIAVCDDNAEGGDTMFGNATVKTQTAGSYVNLREGASARAAVIGKVYDGERVNVLREAGAGWIYGKMQAGAEGYMSADYIVEDAPGADDAEDGDGEEIASTTTLTDGNGAYVTLVGRWKVTND
ncbi:MAG: SH3 domain-containing protein [Oscillospiraceae bacterium]